MAMKMRMMMSMMKKMAMASGKADHGRKLVCSVLGFALSCENEALFSVVAALFASGCSVCCLSLTCKK